MGRDEVTKVGLSWAPGTSCCLGNCLDSSHSSPTQGADRLQSTSMGSTAQLYTPAGRTCPAFCRQLIKVV